MAEAYEARIRKMTVGSVEQHFLALARRALAVLTYGEDYTIEMMPDRTLAVQWHEDVAWMHRRGLHRLLRSPTQGTNPHLTGQLDREAVARLARRP
ncbi:hypothetical protein [Rhizobium sp. BK008]|uniref:hypothetical protein n=1 Tax=Rhizobium sp. BK008 TaxID=2587094 RepID=UPI001615D60E|nr:hypothetical protein [Rhizobium sp. BK008]MBB4249418.1 hypothetical protein [Rhizobium sp. BK008]